MYGKYSALVFWAWNDRITNDGIDEQLKQFYDAGIGGVIVHARAGLKIEYMSDQWMDLFAHAVRKAKELGLKVVIYDENGWPSGFAGGMVVRQNPDFAMKQLIFSVGAPCSDEILCSYKKEGDEYAVGGNDLFACVKRNSDYVDLTDRRVTQAFIGLTHEKYREECGDEFGKTIVAVFTDEPQYSSFENFLFPYSCEINGAFREFCGLDLKENLWRLYAEKEGEFKKLYLSFFAERFKKNYTATVAEWCEKNGLDMTGHFSAEDGIISQACGSGGVMPHYRLMQRPGIDYLGRRFTSPVLLKQLESVKNQCGKEVVLSESFGGAGWGTSLKDYSRIWCYQAAFGVNQLCAHLSPYSLSGVRKRDYPGFFSDAQPWWKHAGEFFGRIEALNELLSSGKAKNRVAVLHPVSAAFAMENFSSMQRKLSTQFRCLTENLLDCQIDFDYVDDQGVKDATVEGGKLIVGECEYELVLALDGTFDNDVLNKLSGVKVGIVGVDFFNRRDDVIRWFNHLGYERRAVFTDGEGVAKGLIVTYKQTDEGALVYAFNKNNCDSKTVYLSGEFKAVKEISFNGEERVVPAITCEKGGFCRVSIPAGGAKVFVFLSGGDAACGKEYMEELPIVGSCLKDKNCLTIDRASYSFNGTDYSAVKDVISVASEVYSQGGEVFVKYTFINNSDCRNLTLFTENGYNSVTVNGKQPRRCNERFFSARLMSYDVSDCVIKGENSIVLQFDIPKNVAVQTDWEFESLRNIYFLPVEIESVYLVGDFSVGGSVQWATPEYLIGHGPFTLESYKPCSCNEATGTGAPFYRGVMEIASEVSYSGGEAFVVAEFFGSMAELFINGQSAGCIFDGDRLNVTKWLKTGKNDIKLELYSTNRNLLGAHHHVCGEVKMTGRNTFEGKHGFEDFVNPDASECTYTESYSFVPFGIKGISLIKIK